MKKLMLLVILAGCNGNFSTDSASNTSQDNSVDNSQHGINKCSQGSSLVCRPGLTDGSFEQTQECIRSDGQPVIINGPELVTELPDECIQIETPTEE